MAEAQHDTSKRVSWFERGITKALQNFKTLCKTLIVKNYIYVYITVLKYKVLPNMQCSQNWIFQCSQCS